MLADTRKQYVDGLPCARGGHQMCLDPDKQHIYLLGGWDGQCDMADFWRYRIEDNQWELLSRDIEKYGLKFLRVIRIHGIRKLTLCYLS